MQSAQRVRAWESAVQVAVRTRQVVAGFPRHGFRELRAQMLSAAESISHNIAEGRGSSSPRDYYRFLDMAAKSAHELNSQIDLAVAYGILPAKTAFSLKGTVICTNRMIRALQRTIGADESQRTRGQRR